MFRWLKSKKYLSHSYQYDIDGEDLPLQKDKLNKKALFSSLSITVLVFLVVNYVLVSIKTVVLKMNVVNSDTATILDYFKVDTTGAFNLKNIFGVAFDYQIYLVAIMLLFLLGGYLYSKLNYKSEEEVAYGQKGDSRFTTIEEIEEQYVEIPEKEKSFEGIGGVPISHHKDKYYIDTDTVNSCILGVSRSGKGEMIIFPTIDILSRAEKKSSMVLNDPKGELYAGSKDTLEERGYDVEVLNLQDPLQSMSYNPLELVKEAWLQGNREEAGKRANSIAFTLYNDPNAGENAFFNEGAQNAVTAIILALVEYCYDNNCPEKITMYNVAEMLNELGTLYYKESPEDFVEKNALDEYFMNLPQGHVAKKRYGSTSFAGEKTRGSILSTANQGLQPFVDPLFAKMTSKNSIDLKQLGFSKSLHGQLHNDLVNKRIHLSFHKNNKEKTVINKYRIKVKPQGYFSLNFDDHLTEGDLVLIKFKDEALNKTYKIIYKLHFKERLDDNGDIVYRKEKGYENVPEMSRNVEIKELANTFPHVQQKLSMRYSDKPTAVFMIIPDYDSSNHSLASIYTKQLYTTLAMQCGETKGNKCFTRVQFIMDEFGNMPPIDDMDQIMTVCLGRNIIFNLVVQSYSQLNRKYSEGAETIKENCQNHIYIMSTNDETIEELSKKAGHTTLIALSSNEEHLEMDNKITKSADQQRIITPDRLSQFIEGETLVIRSLHRQDNNRRKVRPFPIFNTGKTNMPYRYQFLGEWFDTSKDLNDIDIHSEHSSLALESLNVNFGDFIVNKDARDKYVKSSQRQATDQQIDKAESQEVEIVKDQKLQGKEVNRTNIIKTEFDKVIDDIYQTLNEITEKDKNHHELEKIIKHYMKTKKIPTDEQLNNLANNIKERELIKKIRILKMVKEN